MALGLILGLSGLLAGAGSAEAASLEEIRQLEDRINAGRHRLVLCRNVVNLADVEAEWEVMAHESTHVIQACTGTTAIADESMPRTFRELRTMAPHYAKLIDLG